MALQPYLNQNSKQLYWLRETTGEKNVINSRAISNTTGAPNPGPNQEYLPIKKEEIIPDYDPRFVKLGISEAPNEGETEVHITYSVTDREVEEVNAAIDNAERLQVQKHYPLEDQQRDNVLALAAIFRQSKGLQLTEDEQAAADRIVAVAVKLKQNKDKAAQFKEQVANGNKPDIDSEWAVVS